MIWTTAIGSTQVGHDGVVAESGVVVGANTGLSMAHPTTRMFMASI